MDIRRRSFLKTSAAASLAGMFPTGLALSAEQQQIVADAITRQTLAEAEKLTGVAYTDAEREQIIQTIHTQIKLMQNLRTLGTTNADPAPALVFNPRLPRTKMPVARWNQPCPDTVPPLPDSDADIAFAPVRLLSEWIRQEKLTSRRLTEIYLRRIDRYAGKLECIVTVTRELALKQADYADAEIAAGKYRGPLHGIPYGAKDLFDTRGIRTTWGAVPYKDRIAGDNAAVIDRLEQAGAVLIAKTTLGALAFGDLWFAGLTRNPWNLEEGSGGSSAGSGAAVAAGLMGFALGTETLGSIENPASKNGVAGLRPTFGRVSRHGAMVLCWSLDKVGALCRSVEDTMLVLQGLNGYDPRDASSIDAPLDYDTTLPVSGMRIGYQPEWFNNARIPASLQQIPEILTDMGMQMVEITLPDLPYSSLTPILKAEAAAALEELTLSDRDDLLRGQTLLAWPNTIREARFLPAVDIIQADRLRRRVMHIIHDLLEDVDAIVGPSIPVRGGGTIMSLLTNFSGHPAITLKTGFTGSTARRSNLVDPKYYGAPPSTRTAKVPACVSFWGKLFEEGKLCRIAAALEDRTGVSATHPTLFT